MARELQSITPLVGQITLRKLGCYSATYLGNDLYFLIEAIHLLKSDIGEEFARKEWESRGKSWEKTMKILQRAEKKTNEVKAYYDPIEDKKFDKRDKEIKPKKFYTKTASKIPLLSPEVYDLFVFLVKCSTLQRQTIPSDAFKILEHAGYKKIELAKKTTAQAPVKTEEISQASD
jgi:hypothetical protein